MTAGGEAKFRQREEAHPLTSVALSTPLELKGEAVELEVELNLEPGFTAVYDEAHPLSFALPLDLALSLTHAPAFAIRYFLKLALGRRFVKTYPVVIASNIL